MSGVSPISREHHSDKRWIRPESFSFAARDTLVAISADEVPVVSQVLPLAFVRHEDRFLLVAVQGLQASQNLLVNADGQWMTDYIPVLYRNHPFQLIAHGEQQVLCIADAQVSTTAQGEAFFSGENISDEVSTIMERLKRFNASRQLADELCKLLTSLELIEPWNLTLKSAEKEESVGGLYRINEAALGALPDDAFLQLRKAGALPLIYCQLLSMQKTRLLSQLLGRHRESETLAKLKTPSQGDTFSFAGL